MIAAMPVNIKVLQMEECALVRQGLNTVQGFPAAIAVYHQFARFSVEI